MKKLKHEAELFKAAVDAGVEYGEKRKAVIFEPHDSQADKALYIYRLLVHDKLLAPMPEEQVSAKSRAIVHRITAKYAEICPPKPRMQARLTVLEPLLALNPR